MNIRERIGDFISDVTPGWVYRLNDWRRDFWYGRFIRRHWQIRTKLPKRSWIDSDSRILYGMMQVLDEFYRDEMSLNIVDWESQEDIRNAKRQLDEIKTWWDNYPNRQKAISDKLTEWSDYVHSLNPNFLEWLNARKDDPKERALNKELHDMEALLLKEEQEMLHKLIDLRHYMWT